jgi:hypothetical protein
MQLRRVWVDTAAGVMHSRVGGDDQARTPVVLVHGLVISSRYMVPTALELAPLCPVYAVDLPGYGDSAASGHARIARARGRTGGLDGRYAAVFRASGRQLVRVSGPGRFRRATCSSRGSIGLSRADGRRGRSNGPSLAGQTTFCRARAQDPRSHRSREGRRHRPRWSPDRRPCLADLGTDPDRVTRPPPAPK